MITNPTSPSPLDGPLTPEQLQMIIDMAAAAGTRAALDQQQPGTGVHPDAPLVHDHIKTYLAKCTANTRRTYATHLNRLRDGIGPTCDQTCEPCLDATASTPFVCRCDCAKCTSSRVTLAPVGHERVSAAVYSRVAAENLAAVALRIAVKRGLVENRSRSKRGLSQKRADGFHAQETAIAAVRSLFKSAEVFTSVNHAADVDKPRRGSSDRRGLRDFELLELCYVTATGGNDPTLDTLLVDYSIATGARREGSYTLTIGQIAPHTQIIWVRDKYKKLQPAPVSLELINRLMHHAISRGGAQCDPTSPEYRPDAPVFYYRARPAGASSPLTSRRFDTLHQRWQSNLGWANDEQVTYHRLRHTISAYLASMYGPQHKKRYLRHADGDVTDQYGVCTLEELARAMSDLLQFEHPLVHGVEERRTETLKRLGRGSAT